MKELVVKQMGTGQKRLNAAPRGTSALRATRVLPRLAGAAAALPAVLVLGGCLETDSFMDPGVVGRWENTPTTVPILERLDIVEHDSGEFVETSDPLPEDLIPEPGDYRVTPGDTLQVTIYNFLEGGAPGEYTPVVNARGNVSLPQVGEVRVAGKTQPEALEAIRQAIIDADIIDDPLVSLVIAGQRDLTFNVFGAVPNVGRYSIPSPSYRLLDALTDAGGVSPSVQFVYVIRQVPLSNVMKEGIAPAREPERAPAPPTGTDLLDLIDETTAPATPTTPPAAPSQGETSDGWIGLSALEQDGASTPAATADQNSAEAPPIDLPDTSSPATAQPIGIPGAGDGTATAGDRGGERWVFLDGRWMKVMPQSESAAGGLPEGADPLSGSPAVEDLVTERVIKIPVAPLIRGGARYNIVIRPGDLISVPGPDQGVVYVTGPGINRPGTYALPQSPPPLTLMRVVAAAGGTSAIAIPERTDIVRMVGENRQAFVRVNLRAVHEGTQPDLYLKPGDYINVGTNFWATPLAVIRGGFRASYGFGFLLDRNFGNDVFGAPPTNRGDFN